VIDRTESVCQGMMDGEMKIERTMSVDFWLAEIVFFSVPCFWVTSYMRGLYAQSVP